MLGLPLLVLICIANVASAQTLPGAKLQLSQHGMDYAADIGVSILSTRIIGEKLPEESGTTSMSVGNVEWTISNARIRDFLRPTSRVTVSPSTGITWATNNAQIKVNGDWRYTYRVWRMNVGDNGRFDLDVSGASTSVSVEMGKDATGRLTVRVLQCSCSISTVTIKLHGGASWVYNLFSSTISSRIKTELQDAVCTAATKTINENGSQQLARMELNVAIDNSPLIVDCSLIENPVLISGPNGGYIETSNKAEAFWNGIRAEAPFRPPSFSIPAATASTRMVTVYISDYVTNTVGHVLHSYGYLSINVSRTDAPASAPAFFSTNCVSSTGLCFGSLFPRSRNVYPNSLIQMTFSTTECPRFAISTTSVSGTLTGKITVIATTDATHSGQLVSPIGNVMSLSVTATVEVVSEIQGSTVTAAFRNFSPTVSVISSNIGNLEDNVLTQMVEFAGIHFIVPSLNAIGQNGFPIPTPPGVVFVEPTISTINGAIVLSTDVRYDP